MCCGHVGKRRRASCTIRSFTNITTGKPLYAADKATNEAHESHGLLAVDIGKRICCQCSNIANKLLAEKTEQQYKPRATLI